MRMKAKELRAWIGKEIEWDTSPDVYRGWYDTRSGTLLEVRGLNLHVDNRGSYDWLYTPGIRNIRLKASGTVPPEELP